MRRIVYSTLLFLLLSLSAVAQNGGINFQGMARNAAGEALANQKISLRLSVLLNSESGTVEYSETKEATTSGQGIFSVVIGDGSILTKTGNFSDINWKTSPKFLKVELDPSGGTNFALMGTSRLQAVPFAYYANGVDAENIQGTLPVAKGGTGVGSITALKTSLAIDQVNNTADANKPISTATQAALGTKVDKVTGKELSSNDYTTAEKNKLAAISGTNTGDQDLSGLATTAALATKANTSDVTTSLALKANTADVTTALAGKANTTEVTAGLAGKVDKVTGKELSTNDFTTAEKTKLAAISGTNTGDQDLSGLATTAALATKANTSDVTASLALKANTADVTTALATKANTTDVTTSLAQKANTADVTTALATKANTSDVNSGLDGKENVSNKSTAVDLGGTSPSDVFYPSQKAVKAYIAANAAAGGIADGGITTIKLADDAVTDAKVANGINKSKVGLGNVENTALTTWSGSTNLTTVGTITSGTWDGTAINYSKLNLAQSIVSDDIADGTISMRKLGIAKGDLVSLGLAGDEELVIYRAGQGLSETTATIGVRSSGAPRVETTFDLNPVSTNFIQDGAVTNDKIALGISKSKVGLGNVDNTSDALKPISTSTQTALDLKAPLESPTFTGTVSGITKSMVGLGNVDNTSDSNKPISTAAQTVLNLKAPLESPTFTGTVSGITKSMVGLGNVDNTSDSNKPISSATQNALDAKANSTDLSNGLAAKAPLNSPTFTGTVSGITKSMVGLGNVDNTSDSNKPISSATQNALDAKANSTDLTNGLAAKAPLNSPTFTGTVSGITKSMVGLGNVDNTSDSNKPISSATQNALDAKANSTDLTNGLAAKAPLNSPTFTGTVSGITKSMVGLGNVENTALSTWTGSTALEKVGTIVEGMWNGTSVSVAYGGTGTNSFGTNHLLVGDGTNPIQGIAPGTSGNLLTSNGTEWVSSPASINAASLTGTTLADNVINSDLETVGTLTHLETRSMVSTGKVVIGDEGAKVPSAILEVYSTTQGFLPPRMTLAQRNAISSPIAGLVIWCSNCGPNGELQVFGDGGSWLNLVGGTTAGVFTPTVGQSYRGGIVAYILRNGDPGYDANTPHGIIVSLSDQNTTGLPWSWEPNVRYLGPRDTNSRLGQGKLNTETIANHPLGRDTPAFIASRHRGGGFSDWHLPSEEELKELFSVDLGSANLNTSAFYWSSSEYDNLRGTYCQKSGNGSFCSYLPKGQLFRVRAIRYF